MTPWMALVLLEVRRMRTELVTFCVAILVIPAIVVVVAPGMGREGAAAVAAGLLAFIAALAFGAGTFAGEPAPAFVASRAVSPVTALGARLMPRFVALLIVFLCGMFGLGLLDAPIEGLGLDVAGALAILTLTFLGGALASVFEQRPIAAVVDGVAGSLFGFLATLAVAALRGPWGEHVVVLILTACLVVAPLEVIALFLLVRKRADAAWDGKRFLTRAAAVSLVVPLVALVGWVILGNIVAGARLDRAHERWTREHGAPVVSITAASPQALQADAIARRLGLPLSGHEITGERHSLSVASAVSRAFTSSEFQVPTIASAWLDDHESDMDELRSVLAGGGIAWPVQHPDGSPIPNLVAHVFLARLLVFDAARLRSAGEGLAAEADIAAIRSLSEGLLRHPSLLARLVGVGLSSMEARAVRLSGGAAPVIAPDFDAMERLLHEAMSLDVAYFTQTARGIAAPGFERSPRPYWALRLFALPWGPPTRWQAAAALDEASEDALAMRELGTCVLLEMEDPRLGRSRRGEIVAAPVRADIVRRRIALAVAEWELAGIVREIRALREVEQVAAIPAELLASRACEGRSWILTEGDDGWRIDAWEQFSVWGILRPPWHRETGAALTEAPIR